MGHGDVYRVQSVQAALVFFSGGSEVHVVAGQIREEKFARLAQLQLKVMFLE